MIWIALFSNSGNELVSICEKLGRYPEIIYCDKVRTQWNSELKERAGVQEHADIMRTLKAMPNNVLVTLHGYLRIIPPHAIKPNMFNVHPGDIETYPELKGIHPQVKALELKLPSTGVVIHRVNEGVDEGEIVSRKRYQIAEDETEVSLINNLRDISVDMWVDLLRKHLK